MLIAYTLCQEKHPKPGEPLLSSALTRSDQSHTSAQRVRQALPSLELVADSVLARLVGAGLIEMLSGWGSIVYRITPFGRLVWARLTDAGWAEDVVS